MNFFNGRIKDIIIGVLLVIIAGLLVVIFLNIDKNKEVLVDEQLVEEREILETKIEEEVVTYYVDVKGAVKKPGVYKISKGSIVNDVIKLAGGLKSNASTKYINLSYEVKNHDVINIYTSNEVKKNDIKEVCVCPQMEIIKCDNSSVITESSDGVKEDVSNNADEVLGKINLNSATLDQLMTLNGVGEAKALAIIEYRKNNIFTKIEDLMNVSGIGESLYNKVKEDITV